MHPQNVFGEVVLLFIAGLVLLIRDRGSAVSSTAYDTLIGCLALLFSIIRLLEFLGGSRDGQTAARALLWFMWLLPVIILAWQLYHHRRLDVGILLAISVLTLIGITVYLLSGSGGYDIISPDNSIGSSNGVYSWIRTDGVMHFLPFGFYVLLAVALIYLTALSIMDRVYWLLVGVTVAAYIIAGCYIPQVRMHPLTTLGSLTTLIILGLAVFTVLLVPG